MELAIGVIDSGVGGASILKTLLHEMPNEKYVYLADTLNAPYGDKSSEKIISNTLALVDFLVLKRGIKMLVVACNTVSAVAKEAILSKFPSLTCVFVEPPIKTAIEKNKKKILVLATKRTLKENVTLKYYCKEAKKKKIKVKKLFIKDLAKCIDDNYHLPKKIDELLAENLIDKDYDAIVLGCTHYNLIRSNIKKLLPKTEIITCEKAVAKQAKKLLEEKEGKLNYCQNARKKFDNVEIILTGVNFSVLTRLIAMFPGSITANEKD